MQKKLYVKKTLYFSLQIYAVTHVHMFHEKYVFNKIKCQREPKTCLGHLVAFGCTVARSYCALEVATIF